LQENATRLKAYKANLAVFPRRAGKPKAGDASAEQLQTAQQLKGKLLPGSKAAAAVEKVAVTADMKVGWGWG
jgi:large subunit ribosomal protein L13e